MRTPVLGAVRRCRVARVTRLPHETRLYAVPDRPLWTAVGTVGEGCDYDCLRFDCEPDQVVPRPGRRAWLRLVRGPLGPVWEILWRRPRRPEPECGGR